MVLKIAAQAFEAGESFNIFLRFVGFWDSFCYKNFSCKKSVVCDQYCRNIHDPCKLVNAFKSSILLLLGLPIILEVLLKNLRKGAQFSVKLQGWGLQPF